MRRAAVLGVVLGSRLLFGWGGEGHRLVARIAAGLLTTEAHMEVARLLEPGESLMSVADWADEIRSSRKETENWHFVDIPIDSAGFDWKRDCANGCVVSKVLEFRKLWAEPSTNAASRREALLFLVHFAGDLHQPLHCANNHDRGGNDVRVDFLGAPTNLHALWDTGLLQRMPEEDRLFAEISADLTPERTAQWSRGTVEDWANESFRLAKKAVYGPLPPPPLVPGEAIVLGEAYERGAAPVIREQIAKAGLRLAAMLNATAR